VVVVVVVVVMILFICPLPFRLGYDDLIHLVSVKRAKDKIPGLDPERNEDNGLLARWWYWVGTVNWVHTDKLPRALRVPSF
jgi:hypothetical protein